VSGTDYSIEINARLPDRLARLAEFAGDLVYSWDRDVRGVFWRLDADLWRRSGNNPRRFLREVSQERLDQAACDVDFLQDYAVALAARDTYLDPELNPTPNHHLNPDKDLVAYFCAEYGFHESFPIYSGGLGILAGDHCKAASDLRAPFVAVGLLYREGYFIQTIDSAGQQHAQYPSADFSDLPITPLEDDNGEPLLVHIDMLGRRLGIRLWNTYVGHSRLILLDTDIEENDAHFRAITHRLYGGDRDTRIRQEIVLGIGGVRALRALGLEPTVWHINEGHAAFMILERARELTAGGLDFDAAMDAVAAATVFTTHTPVPAGHDRFDHDMMKAYFETFVPQLTTGMGHVLGLGWSEDDGQFNMTALALRGSRFHNGVSEIHGRLAAKMESYVWPDVPACDNPMRHVTNGVHLQTVLARQWSTTFHDWLRDWRNHLLDEDYWQGLERIPTHMFISVRRNLKSNLLTSLKQRLVHQHHRNGTSEALISRILGEIADDRKKSLVIGFARRFATYKRATLLLQDRERLARLLGDPDRPVIMVFAGKAHPNDQPGQALIRKLYETSLEPEFIGRLLMVEGYDMQLARELVAGCDIWLNTPEYPMEASGTSGMKAGINGTLNVSVLDGWWPEGYDGENGWAVTPVAPSFDHDYRNHEEANELFDILEHEVVPMYYGPSGEGYSAEWVRRSRRSMMTLIPRFNASRMFSEYRGLFYGRAARHGAELAADDYRNARDLSAWKRHVREAWPDVRATLVEPLPTRAYAGEPIPIAVDVELNGLTPEDVAVECIIGIRGDDNEFQAHSCSRLVPTPGEGRARYTLDCVSPVAGSQIIRLRIYPTHAHFAHPFELGLMRWL